MQRDNWLDVGSARYPLQPNEMYQRKPAAADSKQLCTKRGPRVWSRLTNLIFWASLGVRQVCNVQCLCNSSKTWRTKLEISRLCSATWNRVKTERTNCPKNAPFQARNLKMKDHPPRKFWTTGVLLYSGDSLNPCSSLSSVYPPSSCFLRRIAWNWWFLRKTLP